MKATLTFDPLVNTGGQTGRVSVNAYLSSAQQADRATAQQMLDASRGNANQDFTIAAHIHGSQKDDELPPLGEELKTSKEKTNVIYVADMDTLSDSYVQARNFPIQNKIEYRYENMAFVMNIIDSLADEETYLGIRNRKVDHVTLVKIEETYEKAMKKVYDFDQELSLIHI